RACGTCSPPTSWAKTSCMGTSSRGRTGPGSWSSAATFARSTRRPLASRSSAITSHPNLATAKDGRAGAWAQANNAEIAYTPANASWLTRIEAQFTALRYSALDGTDHASHEEQGSMIRRYIIWRNNHAYDERLRRIIDRANVA